MKHPALLPPATQDNLGRALRLVLGAWLLGKLPGLISAAADPRSLCVQAVVGLALIGVEIPWAQLLARFSGR